jgi:hypothetical protein
MDQHYAIFEQRGTTAVVIETGPISTNTPQEAEAFVRDRCDDLSRGRRLSLTFKLGPQGMDFRSDENPSGSADQL